MTPMLLRAAFVALMLLWANPSLPVWILALYFFVQHEALVIRANRETTRVNRLIAILEEAEHEDAADEEERLIVQQLEDEALGQALLLRYWPEQRH